MYSPTDAGRVPTKTDIGRVVYIILCGLSLFSLFVIFCVGLSKDSSTTAQHMAYTFKESYSPPPASIGWSAEGSDVGEMAEAAAFRCLSKTTNLNGTLITCPADGDCTVSTKRMTCETGGSACTGDNLATSNCLSVAQSLSDSKEIASLVWYCVSNHFPPLSHEKDLYDACFQAQSWAVSDVLQDANADAFLGSYNWFVLLFIGLWLQGCFALYCATVSGDYKAGPNGKQETSDALVFLILSLFGTGFCPFVILLVMFYGSYTEPMDSYTLGLGLTASTLAFMYVLSEMVERYEEIVDHYWSKRSGKATPGEYQQPTADVGFVQKGNASAYHGAGYAPLRARGGAQMHIPISYGVNMPQGQTIEQADFLPLHVTAWADGRVLTEGLVVLGLVGIYQGHMTHEVVNLFLGVLYMCVAHTAFVRCLTRAYIEQPKGNNEKSSDQFGVRVMAFMGLVASLYFFIVGAYSTLNNGKDDPQQSYGINVARYIHAAVIFTIFAKAAWTGVYAALELGTTSTSTNGKLVYALAGFEGVLSMFLYMVFFIMLVMQGDDRSKTFNDFVGDYKVTWGNVTLDPVPSF